MKKEEKSEKEILYEIRNLIKSTRSILCSGVGIIMVCLANSTGSEASEIVTMSVGGVFAIIGLVMSLK